MENNIFVDKERITEIFISLEQVDSYQRAIALLNKKILESNREYLFFHVGNDSVDRDVLEAAADFLDKNDVNIVVFPQAEDIETYDEENEDNVTGLYNIHLEPELKVGTFNFVVRKCENRLFNEELNARCAYLDYFLRAVTEKLFFGYLKMGVQYHEENFFDWFRIQTYEEYENFYKFFLNVLEKKQGSNGYADELTQGIVIKAIDDLLMEGALIPEIFSEEEKKTLRGLLGNIIDDIDIIVMKDRNIFDNSHLCYFLSLRSKQVDVLADKNKFGVFYGTEEILSWRTVGFHVNSLKIENGKLRIVGCFRNPASCLMEFVPYIVRNGKMEKAETTASKSSYRGTSQVIANYQDYKLEVPYDENATFTMKALVQGQMFPVKIILHPQIPVNTVRGTYKLVRNGVKYTFTDRKIIIKKLSLKERILEEKWDYQDFRQMYPETFKLRNKIKINKLLGKKVQLYIDKNETPGFKELFEKEAHKGDKIVRYYCSDKEEHVNGKFVLYGSDKHKLLSGIAEKVFTTSPRYNEYSAFDTDEWKYYRDLMESRLVYVCSMNGEFVTDPLFVVGEQNMDEKIILNI